VRFADAGRADEDEIARGLEPLGLNKLHEFVSGDPGIKRPVEVAQSFDSFDARHTEQVLDSFLFPELRLLGKETEQEGFFLIGETFDLREQLEEAPEFMQGRHSL